MSNSTSLESTSDRVTAFAHAVVTGELIAGPDVRNAGQRHLNDLETGGAARGLVWDVEAANHAIGFFEDVLHLNGGDFEGLPFQLHPWQAFIVGSLFGWKTEDGYRRYRTAYIETAKGSGKSPLVAGIGLYGLVADKEYRAEVFAAATKRDQAMVLFKDAVAMVDLSPELHARIQQFGGKGNVWNLAYHKTGSFFRAISADEGQSGPRPHIALIDEIHEHKSRVVVDMLRAGTKSRRQALIVMITNSGTDRASICYQYHEYGIAICKGDKIDDAFFAFVCSLDEGDDPFKSETCWPKVNPSLPHGTDSNGGVPGYKYLREQVTEARGMPAKESSVRRLCFCEWTDAENPWITADVWMACERDFSLEDIPQGELCYGGLDLSGTGDLTALGFYFPRLQRAFVEFWTPQDTLMERTSKDKVPYDAWVREGYLHAPKGSTIDYQALTLRLGELAARFDIRSIAYDPHRIKYLEPELAREGIDIALIPHGQGWNRSTGSDLWMTRSIEVLEKALTTQTVEIMTNPCLRWNAACAVIDADVKNDRRAFDKRKSTGRIDGVVALAMAFGAADMPAPEPLNEFFVVL